MKVKLEDDTLVIEVGLTKRPKLSTSAKTYLVATTGGFQAAGVTIGDQPVSISVNATVPNEDAPAADEGPSGPDNRRKLDDN